MKEILDPRKLSAGAGLPATGPESTRPAPGHATAKWQVGWSQVYTKVQTEYSQLACTQAQYLFSNYKSSFGSTCCGSDVCTYLHIYLYM